MAKLKVAEAFYSLQGEGAFAGVPSVFLRTYGCNFTCSGFGMPRGAHSEERLTVDPLKYKKYDELPLVHTGCDSYASWDVRFKDLSPLMEVSAVADHITSLIPHNTWDRGFDDVHLVITGGEPLLGWQRSYPELLSHPKLATVKNVTFETNGTQPLQPKLVNFFNETRPDLHVKFSVSAKLPASGELWEHAICPDVVARYRAINNSSIYFKFVVGEPDDVASVLAALEEYRMMSELSDVPVYLMPVGGTDRLYYANNEWVANTAMKLGFRYSPRLQVDLWKNAWGT